MAKRATRLKAEVTSLTPVVQPSAAGGMEGAERTHRATVMWNPDMGSPDRIINRAKPLADARVRDVARNDGYVQAGVNIRKDGIVGAEYRLNADPVWKVIPGGSEDWAAEFQEVVENRFRLAMESDSKWIDQQGVLTFTGLIRLGVGVFVYSGEVLATAEWVKETARPFKTAIQVVSPDRLSNPHNQMDTATLRRGVERNARGRPVAYHIRNSHPHEVWGGGEWTWRRVPAATGWGRQQCIHIFDRADADQSRGIAEMVSVLKETKMARQFQDIVLQNAIVSATYAAAIESEIPQEAMVQMMGAGASDDAVNSAIANYLGGLTTYLQGANNIKLDGVMIPHLYPGTKLNVRPVGNPGGIGTDFQASLLRYVAAGLGVSYEELSRDYSKVNYSSGKLAGANIEKSQNVKKRIAADGLAHAIYSLWLEEEINAGNVPFPAGQSAAVFYRPLMKEAFTQARWIGAGRGQVDEMKETQAAIMRIKSGLSTYEIELSRLGHDFRDIFAQRAREEKIIGAHGLAFSLDATRGGQGQAAGDKAEENDDDEAADDKEGTSK